MTPLGITPILLYFTLGILTAHPPPVNWHSPEQTEAILKEKKLPPADIAFIQQLVSKTRKPNPDVRDQISSAGLETIVRDSDLLTAITSKELVLDNILVAGKVDLSNIKINVPILMKNCVFKKGLKIRSANLVGLVMENCSLGGFEGDGTSITNDLVIGPGTKVKGEFRLPHARIGGGVSIRERSALHHGRKRDCSINLWNAEVKGEFHIGSSAGITKLVGCILLNGCSLGQLEFENSILEKCDRDPEGVAVLANWSKIRGSLSFGSGTKATGALNFQGTNVGGTVHVENTSIRAITNALNFADARVETSMALCHSDIKNEDESAVRLSRLQLHGDLDIEACSLTSNVSAVNAEGLDCGGRVLLKNNDITGEVRFASARIRGDLGLQSGAYIPGTRSAKKSFTLDNADIGRSTIFSENLDDERAKGVRIEGFVSLRGTRMNADLRFRKCDLREAQLDIKNTSANRLIFPRECRPKELCMDGFGYQRVNFQDDGDTLHPKTNFPGLGEKQSQTRWLKDESSSLLEHATIGKGTFEPQPYEQMASVMRDMGHQKVARSILTEMSDNRMKFADWNWGEWLWFRVFGRIIGYGHNPGQAFWISVVWIFIASFIFWKARKMGWIEDLYYEKKDQPASRWKAVQIERTVPPGILQRDGSYWLQALPYSIEKFVPFLSLGLAGRWRPKDVVHAAASPGPIFIQLFIWAHIIAGWILASLWVGALTGLAK